VLAKSLTILAYNLERGAPALHLKPCAPDNHVDMAVDVLIGSIQ
jgi:hypothetical protein